MIFSLEILKNHIARCDFWAADSLSAASIDVVDHFHNICAK